MANLSLDIEEKQILVYYEGDTYEWHQRILHTRLGEARWIWITPDYDVQLVDVGECDVRPLGRNERIPLDCRPAYLFRVPLSETDLAAARVESKRLAEVMGYVAAPSALRVEPESRWLYADPADEEFGKVVEDAALIPGADLVVRASSALWRRDADDDEEWCYLERVLKKDEMDWLSQKREGPGRDPRLGPTPEVASTVVVLREQLRGYREVEVKNWPFKGPRAIVELLKGVAAGGHELNTYGPFWIRHSGMNGKSAAAVEFMSCLNALQMMVAVDTLDLYNSAAAEHMARRILQIQRAVRRNPQAPDYSGLEAYMLHTTDMGGGILASDFDRYVAEVQKGDAAIMKQNRLLKEEEDAVVKKKKGGGGPPEKVG